MSHNSITIALDAPSLTSLSKEGYSLCVAKVLADSSGEVSNVIMATAPQLQSNMLIRWSDDEYQIHAASDPVHEAFITGWSTPMPISLGHSYVMKSWDDPPKVINDPEAPTNGFGFKNGMVCSAVVSIRDPHTKEFVPIYISPEPLIPGTGKLTPLNKVVLWFGKHVTTATMITVDKSSSLLVDCTDGPQTVTYKEPGLWVGP